MKKVCFRSMIAVVMIAFVVSCAVPPPPSAQETKAIKAGDRIGDMLLTTVDEINWDSALPSYCDIENEVQVTDSSTEIECQAPPGAAIFLNCQGVSGYSTESLDTRWEELNAEIIVDGLRLDLPSFGAIDNENENDVARMWNLAIENLTPGAHAIRCIVDHPSYAWDTTWNFTVPEMIGPGDKIGDMTVEQGTQYSSTPELWNFCEHLYELEPGTDSVDCNVPLVPELLLEIGWGAKVALIDSNWDEMNFELYIDDYKINLEEFDWIERDHEYLGYEIKARNWWINLLDLPLGEHSMHYWWSLETPVDDGFDVYQPGNYDHIVNFTVGGESTYLPLSSGINTGLQPYTSQKAGLDYWIYVPEDYIKDTEQDWPLIVYLHGTLPGSDLGVLKKDVLLQKLGSESDFPFVVVAPRVEGQYEFWAEEETIDSLDSLLGEIQNGLSVDPERIYVTGPSAGGNGTWALGLAYPGRFAALAPVMGYFSWPFAVPENICDLKDVPVWAFHAENDEVVPLEAEQMLVDALETCGGNVQFTVDPDAGHDFDGPVYSGTELFDWFLAQSLE